MQMGGGCILYVDEQQLPPPLPPPGTHSRRASATASAAESTLRSGVKVKPGEVFEALCDCVFASKR